MQPSRRQFIRQVAIALALAAFPFFARAAAAPAGRSPLGMSLYGMKTLPLSEALAQCARIGYRNVELCIDPGFPADPAKFDRPAREKLRAQAHSLGLTFSGMMLNLDLANEALHAGNLRAIAAAAELAHDLAPDAPPPIETVLRGKPAQWDALKAGMVQRLGEWADAAKAGGVRFVIKAHITMAVNSPERLIWLLQQVNRPEIRVAFDFSHYEVAGLDLERCWNQLKPWVDFVHVKDTAGTPKKPIFLLPGEGHTDYVRYFRMLRSSGYTGPVVVEVSTQIFTRPKYDPVKAAESSYAALSRAFAAASALGTTRSTTLTQPALSLGYSLYGMKTLPVEEAVRQIARIGYKNIELTIDAGFPAEPRLLSAERRQALREQARAAGVRYSALMLGIPLGGAAPIQEKNLAAIREGVKLAKDLSPQDPPPVEVILGGGKPALWEEQKERLAENLRAWVAAAAENGGTMVIGAHANMTVNTAEKLLWLYQQAKRPELGLYYNHIHFALGGMPLAESWKLLGPYVKFIHLQEATGTPEKRNYMLPGAGHTTDFAEYFRMLNETGYHGPLVVEVSGAIWKLKGYDPIQTAETCYASMEAALEKSGVPHE